MTSPNQDNSLNQDLGNFSSEPTANTQTPHSGSERVSEEMRDFHPTGEFDGSKLEDVANERTAGGEEILTVPDSPATNPDGLRDQYNLPSVIPAKKHRDSKNTIGNGKKISLIAGGLGAGAGLVGAAVVIGGVSGESDNANPVMVATTEGVVNGDNILDKPPSETVITVEAVPVSPVTTEAATARRMEFSQASLADPEVVNPDFEPILLTSNDPQELASQIIYLESGLQNVNNPEAEQTFLQAKFGNTSRSQNITEDDRMYVETIRTYMQGARDFAAEQKEEYPYIEFGAGEVQAEQPDPSTITLTFDVAKRWAWVNHPENLVPSSVTYVLEKSTTLAENTDELGLGSGNIWVIRQVRA